MSWNIYNILLVAIMPILLVLIPKTTKKLYAIRTDDYSSHLYTKTMTPGIITAQLGYVVGCAVISWIQLTYDFSFLKALIMLAMLYIIAVATATDLYAQLIPHAWTMPSFLVIMLLTFCYEILFEDTGWIAYLVYYWLSTIFMFIILYVPNLFYKDHAIGGGDLLLFCVIAQAEGLGVFPIFCFAAIAGLIYACGQWLVIRRFRKFPFAPAILMGYIAWITVKHIFPYII